MDCISMERYIPGINRKGCKTKVWIRNETEVVDIMDICVVCLHM